MRTYAVTLAILTLGMGAAVTGCWLAFASRNQSFGLDPAAVLSLSRLWVYGTQFLLIGAFVFWLAQGPLRHASARHVGLLVTAAWLGEGLVLTVIGEPIVANELDPGIAWYYWLVATGGPLQPAAAFAGGWLGLRHADVRANAGRTQAVVGSNPTLASLPRRGRTLATRRLGILVVIALIALVVALGLRGPAGSRPRTAEQREELAQQLLAGIRVSTTVAGSSLAATKALVDFLPENDVRLVLVRIVDDLELELRIETDKELTFSEPPSVCLIGPFSAPDDGGFSSPCWGAPEIGELAVTQLTGDAAGHAVLPPGRVLSIAATVHRVGGRCDYPPGQWLLRVEADLLVDGMPMGARQLPDVAFDVPYLGTGPLPFVPISSMRYCGLANVVYREQGEPEVASPSP